MPDSPYAAVLGDAVANPTALQLGAANELFNGTTWERARSATAAPVTAVGRGVTTSGIGAVTGLSAVAVTGPGATTNLGVASSNFTMVTTLTGTPATVSVVLEGSLDGTTWFALATDSSAVSGTAVFAVDKPATQLRANLTGLVGGTSPTVTAKFTATS